MKIMNCKANENDSLRISSHSSGKELELAVHYGESKKTSAVVFHKEDVTELITHLQELQKTMI